MAWVIGHTIEVMLKRVLVVLVAAALGAAAFVYFNQDTRHDVVLRHAAKFDVIRQQLSELAGAVPPRPDKAMAHCPGAVEGEHLFSHDNDQLAQSNTGVVLFEQLQNPAATPERWDFLTPTLPNHIAAVSPGYRPTAEDDDWADEEYTRAVEATANVKYVLVVQTGGVKPPSDPESSISLAYLGFNAVIAELSTRKVLCIVDGTAGIDGDVWYAYPRDAGPGVQSQRAHEAADDALRVAARVDLEERLNSLGRGSFSFS